MATRRPGTKAIGAKPLWSEQDEELCSVSREEDGGATLSMDADHLDTLHTVLSTVAIDHPEALSTRELTRARRLLRALSPQRRIRPRTA